MIQIVFGLATIFLLVVSLPARASKIEYPKAFRSNQFDVYFGERVRDPYRWMEDEHKAPTQRWLEKEKRITIDYIDAIPVARKICHRVNVLNKYDRFQLLACNNDKLLFSSAVENQKTFLIADVVGSGEPQVVLSDKKTGWMSERYDCLNLSRDGTKLFYTVTATKYIPATKSSARKSFRYAFRGVNSAKPLVYCEVAWTASVTSRIRNLESENDYQEELKDVKLIDWNRDSSGFYYVRYTYPKGKPDGENGSIVYFHKLGTSQATDRAVLVDKRLDDYCSFQIVDDKYLLYTKCGGVDHRTAIFLKRLDGSSGPAELFSLAPERKNYLGINNNRMIFSVCSNDGLTKLVFFPLTSALFSNVRGETKTKFLSESSDQLVEAILVKDRVVATFLHDARPRLIEFTLDGNKVREFIPPGQGQITAIQTFENEKSIIYQYEDFVVPPSLVKQKLSDEPARQLLTPTTKFDPKKFVTKQVLVPQKGSRPIPMFLTYKQETTINSGTPVLLDGYGGYGMNCLPVFDIEPVLWMELGGVYARACIRGGGEYGDQWHLAATGVNKVNSVRDFISCAEWLCQNKITSPQKLAISGTSNGGLLTSACLVKRPDLFGAVCVDSGVLDLLRFYKLNRNDLWRNEYGDVRRLADYCALKALSPLNGVKYGAAYPPTLIVVKEFDSIVRPCHSFKFAAALQHAQRAEKPILLDSQVSNTHGLSIESDLMDWYRGSEKVIFCVKALGFEKDAKMHLDKLYDDFQR